MIRGSRLTFLISAFFTLFLAFFFVATPSFAATSDNPFLQKQSAIKDSTGLESWSNEAMTSNAVILYNSLAGDIPAEVFSGAPTSEILKKYTIGGAFGTMNRMIATLNTPPASGIEYIAQVKDSFLGKPAYAQGVGFNGLQFLLPLWRGFRNAVYVLASLVFIVIGLMIMLRVKISPQAVVTVQSAIPQLITTLILVTFSYAIAGLVIDVCNFVQAIIVALLFSVHGTSLTSGLFDSNTWSWNSSGFPLLSNAGNALFNAINNASSNNIFSFRNMANPDLHTLQILTYRASPGWLSLTMLGGLLGSIVIGFFLGGIGNFALGASGSTAFDMIGRVVGGAVGGVLGGILVPLIICIIVSIWLIKLYFGLLKNYVTIIFQIIFAPFTIGMGAFPNSKTGFSTWILDVFANMAVFPVVGIFLVVLNMVTDAIGSGSLTSTVWAPSLISASSIGGNSGGITPSIIAACVGLAGLALISKLPDMVPQYIFMIKPSPWGQAIGQGLGEIYKNGVTQSFVQGGSMEAGRNFNTYLGTKIDDFKNRIDDKKDKKYKDKHKDDTL